jgi:DNA-binding transcriptional MerR regulator
MTSNIPDRMFYRIKEVCSITGLKPHVLRYWEQEFKDIKPVKSSRGQRLYKKKDLDIIFTIKRLLYEQRYTIEGAKKYMMSKKNMLVLEQIKGELTEVIEMLKKGDLS